METNASGDDQRPIEALIAEFKELDAPDPALVDAILTALGISGFLEIGFALNKPGKIERLAAMNMVEQYVPGLVSEDEHERRNARKQLDDFFEDVPMLNEDA